MRAEAPTARSLAIILARARSMRALSIRTEGAEVAGGEAGEAAVGVSTATAKASKTSFSLTSRTARNCFGLVGLEAWRKPNLRDVGVWTINRAHERRRPSQPPVLETLPRPDVARGRSQQRYRAVGRRAGPRNAGPVPRAARRQCPRDRQQAEVLPPGVRRGRRVCRSD